MKYYIVDAVSGENRGSVVQDDYSPYDPYTDKHAFCSPVTNEEFAKRYADYMAEYSDDVVITDTDDTDGDISDYEYEAAAQKAHDNLVRSLIEAGGTIREAKELLARSLEQLYLLGFDSGFTNSEIGVLITDINKFLER